MEDGIGKLVFVAERLDGKAAFLPLINQVKLLLFGAFDEPSCTGFIHLNIVVEQSYLR